MKNICNILICVTLSSFLLTFDLYGQKNNGGTGIATAVPVMMRQSTLGIVVYPNPVEYNMFVETSNINVKEIKLFNLNGQAQNHLLSIYNDEANIIQINTTQLHTGIYLLRLKTEIGVVTKKIVVQ